MTAPAVTSAVERVRAWVCVCGNQPCDGLDCGVMLNPPRRKPAPKTADEMAAIRAKAWTTRRTQQQEARDGRE